MYTHEKTVNIYTVYELTGSNCNDNDPTVKNFGTITLIKNADIDKYGYSGYGIGFDRRGSFSFAGIGIGRAIIIFEVDKISSTKSDNRKKDILIWLKVQHKG